MQKFFIEENQKKEETIEIIGEDVKHISNVLRMKIGEQILIGNSKSLETYLTQIAKIEKEKVIVKIIEKLDIQTEPNVEIDLYQGLPKADKMELIVQKTTEVGVNSIIPVDMARCIVKLDEKDAKKKIERWQKVAESAAKQSKRSKIPEVKNKILNSSGSISIFLNESSPASTSFFPSSKTVFNPTFLPFTLS